MSSLGLLSIFRRRLQFNIYRNALSLAKTSPTISNKTLQLQIPYNHFNSLSSDNNHLQALFVNDSGSQINLNFRRFKPRKGSRKSKVQEEDAQADDDDEEDDDDVGEENPLLMEDLPTGNDGSQSVTIDVNSLRLDAVAKVAFGCTRARIEESFYKGELLINGEKAPKKSADLSLSDEIDLVLQNNAEDPTKIDIKRFQIVTLPDKATDQGRMKIGIKKWVLLTVDPHTDREEE